MGAYLSYDSTRGMLLTDLVRINDERLVLIEIIPPHGEGHHVAAHVEPAKARELAAALLELADFAEGKNVP